MRHGDHRARKALQELLEPFHALRVQMVGRLVEQEQIGLGQEQAAERDPALLAAREHVHLLLPGRQAQRVGRDFELVGAACS
jgi:chloramphenicol 3-O-phosphotransferase